MYFTLTVNENLANALRAAAELKAEISKVSKEEDARENRSTKQDSIMELDKILCDVINRIASLAGCILANETINESNSHLNNAEE